jgi:uncharacterized protein (TIGR03663 family)
MRVVNFVGGVRTALLLFFVLAVALALRLPRLDTRPLHNDEAVNAIKIAELWEHGRYKYDPDEYHGPTLHYATLPLLWLSGARSAEDFSDARLRLAPLVCGVGLLVLLLLFWDGLGRTAILWAALFVAISPAFVFYSRYFIHEMLLVFFTALTLGAAWRYVQTRLARWAVVTGVGLGLMVTTKETFVLTLAAMGLALIVMIVWSLPRGERIRTLRAWWNWRHAALMLGVAGILWLTLFSSFFTNWSGPLDSIRTYFPWLKRAGGHSPHIHPWYFYFARLGWFHPPKGQFWSEGLILVLALLGAVTSILRGQPLHRFLTLFTLILAGIYSVISYKTPWCLLNFYLGAILLAGLGAATVVDFFRPRWVRVLVVQILLLLALQLTWQSVRASQGIALKKQKIDGHARLAPVTDWRNPYVYAQTVPDILKLVQRTEGIGRVASGGFNTVVKVVAPDSDYWPLPWYLRRFQNLGWYEKLPDEPLAPIMIVSASLDARLDDKTERKWLMVGLTELRPGKFFEQYVELELWKKYVETLPRDRE